MKKVVLFTMEDCPYCQNLKNNLTKLNFEFINIDIHQNNEIWKNIVDQVGDDVVPMVFLSLNDDDDGHIYVPGRDYETEDEIVEIIKNYMK